jgi:hypothetical protein
MTCREKLKIEHPDEVGEEWMGGCCGCPPGHDYLNEPEWCDGRGSEDDCRRCWDREIPGTETCGATDNVNHPKHYETGKFECIDVMVETQGVDAVKSFCLCNAFKYIYRTRRKNGLEDVKKAIWYLEKYVEMEAKQNDNQ